MTDGEITDQEKQKIEDLISRMDKDWLLSPISWLLRRRYNKYMELHQRNIESVSDRLKMSEEISKLQQENERLKNELIEKL